MFVYLANDQAARVPVAQLGEAMGSLLVVRGCSVVLRDEEAPVRVQRLRRRQRSFEGLGLLLGRRRVVKYNFTQQTSVSPVLVTCYCITCLVAAT